MLFILNIANHKKFKNGGSHLFFVIKNTTEIVANRKTLYNVPILPLCIHFFHNIATELH